MEFKTYFIYKEKEVRALDALEAALSRLGLRKSGSGADLVIAIGGDGTFLRAASMFSSSVILPLRYKTHFGLLMSYELSKARIPLNKLAKGEFSIRKEPLIEASVNGRRYISAGDFYFQRCGEVAALRYTALISSGKNTLRISAVGDGFIICTPMGSTGYFSYYDRLLGMKPKRLHGFGFEHILPFSISQRSAAGVQQKPKIRLVLGADFTARAWPTRGLNQFLYSSAFRNMGIKIGANEVMRFRRSSKELRVFV
ncbi:MAG: NAD(+)/NADH kinase [Candidatus Micrarchaeaceae archaeon]